MGQAAHDPLHEGSARARRPKPEQPRAVCLREDHARETVEVALREVEELLGQVAILESFRVEEEGDREEVISEEILIEVFAEQKSPLGLEDERSS